ncbi:metallophosphoesterase 1 homolog isoform X2 [Rhagoletis pomonella]|uniref:metallophosphoesterase 1 homolog isoform X2 n=1 Tax=Rhagoletis pomonella TaxID=28610 RepID=UPI0017810D7E|nr:metallophosphoesterase 1 homolog isoform X2 [Rhagoletis pomonella]
MASLRLINRLVLRGFISLTLLLAFFNEFIIYYISQTAWQQIDCEYDNCTRILFVADPQLIGNSYEKGFWSPISRYDADRYLRKTFERSLHFTQPHIICFLGDLLDEGSIATQQDFDAYVRRFHRIYNTHTDVKRIHVPGDNDIGGEDGEYISNSNVHRFEEAFQSEDLFDYENMLRFFKINRMMLDFTNPDREHNKQRLRVGISHAPILIGGGPLLRSVLSELDPHVIFSGHWHESRIFIHPSTHVVNFYESTVRHFDLRGLKEREHQYLEIMVPTASYRMGKTKMGLGYAVLENYQLSYTVLWQPSRFIYLFLYLFWLILSLCGFIVFRMMTRCPFRVAKRQSAYNRILSVTQF